jgi:hypothetical protein
MAAYGKIRDDNGSKHSDQGAKQWMGYLVLVSQGPGSKAVIQPIHNDYRINQGLVIGQEQNRMIISLNPFQSLEMDAISEAKQQGQEYI